MGKKNTHNTSVQAKKEAPEKLQALVVWVTGEDAGTYTTGISTEWIKNFNYQEWLSTDPEDEDDFLYVVEWRDGPKPLGGWPTYDAKVLEVSANKAVLARAQKRLTEMKSPRLKTPQSKSTDPKLLMPPGTTSVCDGTILYDSDKENQEEEYEYFEPIDKKRRLDFVEAKDDGLDSKVIVQTYEEIKPAKYGIISLAGSSQTRQKSSEGLHHPKTKKVRDRI